MYQAGLIKKKSVLIKQELSTLILGTTDSNFFCVSPLIIEDGSICMYRVKPALIS